MTRAPDPGRDAGPVDFVENGDYGLPVSEAIYPMRVAAQRTGLSPHVIRVWERRYGAVTPRRTETNRRMYSQADIDRLRLLRRAVDEGNAIGRIAALTDEELRNLVGGRPIPGDRAEGVDGPQPEAVVEAALAAGRDLAADRLQSLLADAEVRMGRYAFIRRVVEPLLERIGELWRTGELRVSEEHLTSSVLRNLLGDEIPARPLGESAPVIVLATPTGHLHEFGCLMALAAATRQGWKTIYLGASLPTREIVAAVIQTGARAVGLSLIYPAGDPRIREEIHRLRRQIPPETALLVGGRAASSYGPFEDEGIRIVGRLEDLDSELDRLLRLEAPTRDSR